MGAAVSAVLLGLTWVASFHLGFFQRADQKMFVAFYDLTYHYSLPRLHYTLHVFVSLCNTSHYVYLAAFSLVLALIRRAFRAACAAGLILVGANVTTLVLKTVLPEPRTASLVGVFVPVPYPRWPSGHSTAALALALALVLASPPRLRPLTAGVGAVFAAGVGYGVLAFGTHLPSDVFAGFLVASVWALVATAGLIFADRASAVSQPATRTTVPMLETLGPPAAALVVMAAAAAIVVLGSPHIVTAYARTHEPFVLGGLAILVLSTAISTAVAVGTRGSRA